MTSITVEKITVISRENRYHGWPTVIHCSDGVLRLVYSGGREHHMCPYGRVQMMTSRDEGVTWSDPIRLVDGPIDDRDAGICQTRQGTILVNWFTSFAWLVNLLRMPPESVNRDSWWKKTGEVNDALLKEELGAWMIRSDDGGTTFSRRDRIPVSTPHGCITLSNGRLLMVGRQTISPGGRGRNGGPFREDSSCVIAESRDDGCSWTIIAEIPVRTGDSGEQYFEPHACQAADGRIVVMIRNHNTQDEGQSLQCESHDGGFTWTPPHTSGIDGYPPHLLSTSDGTLVVSYGYRKEPFGNRVQVSRDLGDTWSEVLILNDDSLCSDLGYPSSVELGGGRFLTIWYEGRPDAPAVLRQAIWRLTL
ncbi:MAG: exo-alpha-sialidase [Phycisphaerae bacterium]|nr:exo-alpha-sialidase [Phycisphaerae bacterium]